jgi:hypothetical protein
MKVVAPPALFQIDNFPSFERVFLLWEGLQLMHYLPFFVLVFATPNTILSI